MKRLSVVLATFNEEDNIATCLEAVKDLASEIIIVDGTSTDKTVQIAKKYDAKITITDNPPIFHINKQKAIDKATKDWILQLDADEVVSKELKEEIKEKVLRPDQVDANGFWVPRKTSFLSRFLLKGGQYPDLTLRLYKNGKGRLPQKNVHEQAIVEGEVGVLKNDIIHYSFKDFSDYLDRFNIYTNLIRDEIKEIKPGKSTWQIMSYFFIKPVKEFFIIYIRNKGFQDGFPGFVFAFFSSLRFPVGFVKYWEAQYAKKID